MSRLPLLVLLVFAFTAAPVGAAQQNEKIADGCGPGPFFFCYSPQALTVSSGDRVTWTNSSVTPLGHTITRCTQAACGVSGGTGTDKWPDSGTIHQGQTYSHAFTGAGTYVYYCTIHGYAQMHGTITVRGSSPPPTPPPPTPVLSKLKLKRAAHHRQTVGFTLSVRATVKLLVRRAGKTYRTKTISGAGGHNSTSFGTNGLKKGRYTVTLRPTGGRAASASFTI